MSHGKIWTPNPHSTWNGCVYDRDQNNDVTNTPTVAGSPATLFRAHQAANCPTSMMTQSQIDAREALTCTNVKAAGFVIYSVQVNTGGDATSTVLQNCASSADKFTEIKTANQLLSTFKSIGTALSNLRIAQ